MATIVSPTNVQTMEFDVSTPEGPGRVTIVTGTMSVKLTMPPPNPGGESLQGSFQALVGPVLAAGQFRKATAIASLTAIHSIQTDPNQTATLLCRISEVKATLDDESGQTLIQVDLQSQVGIGAGGGIIAVGFQVTTLAKL